MKAIGEIDRRHETDLDGLLSDEFGVTRSVELTVPQASHVIDVLEATADA